MRRPVQVSRVVDDHVVYTISALPRHRIALRVWADTQDDIWLRLTLPQARGLAKELEKAAQALEGDDDDE